MKRLILKKKLLGLALAALPMTVVTIAVTRPASAQTSVVLDPVGDVDFRAPAFQDIVRGEIQKKSGSFVLRMEMAGPYRSSQPCRHLEPQKFGGPGRSTWTPQQLLRVIRSHRDMLRRQNS